MNGLQHKNVIFTSMELGGIGWITSIISSLHKEMFGRPLKWNYEISRFEATRERRPLPRGWCTVWNALPKDLCVRDYDVVIGVQKNLMDAYYAHFLYKMHGIDTCFEWMWENQPSFFYVVKNNWLRLETDFSHEKYLQVSLDDLNTFTVETFGALLDHLGFPNEKRPNDAELFAIMLEAWFKKGNNSWVYLAGRLIELISRMRPHLIPTKVYRNWESFSNIGQGKYFEHDANLLRINELYLADLKLKEVE